MNINLPREAQYRLDRIWPATNLQQRIWLALIQKKSLMCAKCYILII